MDMLLLTGLVLRLSPNRILNVQWGDWWLLKRIKDPSQLGAVEGNKVSVDFETSGEKRVLGQFLAPA